MVVALPGYRSFILKYSLLQFVRIAAQLSVVIAIFAMRHDLDMDKLQNFELSTVQYAVFGCLGALNVLARLIPTFTKLIINRFKEQLQSEQATATFAKLFDLPHGAVLTTPTGEFMQLIMKVFRNLDPLMPGLYGAVIPIYVETVAATVFIGAVYGPICLLQLGLVVAYSLVAYRAARIKADTNRKHLQTGLAEFGRIMAGAGSYERAHFFGRVDHEIAQTRKSFDKIGAAQVDLASVELIEGARMSLLSLLVTAATVVLVFATVGPHTSTELEVFALIAYFAIFSMTLAEFALGISNLRTAVFEYQAFDAFLSRLSEVGDVEGALELPKDNPMPTIEFKNVSFSYGGRVILDDVSFKVEGGQTLGLVGSSGCGKSTVMRLLLRFYSPSQGQILVDGRDIQQVRGLSLRRLFSVVTQDAALFNGTIRENIGYAKQGATDAELLAAAKLAELSLAEHGDGHGDLALGKECGEKGAKLSGGQQQRVALARAMLKHGTIYLLDEPTTGLDGVVAKQIQATLDTLSERVTTICITHHLDDLKNAHQILYLDAGKIVERGDFASLMAAKGEFYRQVEARKRAAA